MEVWARFNYPVHELMKLERAYNAYKPIELECGSANHQMPHHARPATVWSLIELNIFQT